MILKVLKFGKFEEKTLFSFIFILIFAKIKKKCI